MPAARPAPKLLAALMAWAGLASLPAWADTSFLAVASGDMTANSAIVWTRALDGLTGASGLTLQVSTDALFSNVVQSLGGLSVRDASYDYTLKLDVTGLNSGTKYYYRFQGNNATSDIGSFTTTPAAGAVTGVKLAFSGDSDGLMRPYPLTKNFSAGAPRDFFVYLGDTLYETASNGSPAAFVPPTTTTLTSTQQNTLVADYQRKYRENLLGVDASGNPSTLGQQGLRSLYAAQGNYTLLDNHELGNRQYINGGAPVNALLQASNGAIASQGFDANTTGTYVNQTDGFKAFMKAYNSYQPIRELTVSAPGDARSDGTQQQYSSRDWGKLLSFVSVDDRSYRDVRLKKGTTLGSSTDDTPASYISGNTVNLPAVQRWANANRTMLGSTQLGWLEQTLLTEQANGQVWKVVAVSSPIDQVGNDGGKSWYAGYQNERNQLLKFIDDHGIKNVVFLSTDDHQTRANQLWYSDGGVVKQSSAFTLVTGPLGATGPDAVTNHSFANISGIVGAANQRLALENTLLNGGQAGNAIGLMGMGGRLSNVKRDHDGVLVDGSAADSANFVSPDTFAYANLDVDTNGVLHVSVLGINSYATNTFPGSAADPRVILSFDVAADVAAVPEPATWALWLSGLVLALRRRPRD